MAASTSREIDLADGTLREEPRLIWPGTGGIWPEGPHLYKVKGTYYVMISEGGTSYQHSLTVARSKSPWGPFEANPANPILTHRDKPELPLQAVGHGDLVQTRGRRMVGRIAGHSSARTVTTILAARRCSPPWRGMRRDGRT